MYGNEFFHFATVVYRERGWMQEVEVTIPDDMPVASVEYPVSDDSDMVRHTGPDLSADNSSLFYVEHIACLQP